MLASNAITDNVAMSYFQLTLHARVEPGYWDPLIQASSNIFLSND